MGDAKRRLELVKDEKGDRCRTCKWWHRELEMPPDIGACRYNPPTCFLIMVPGRIQGRMDMQVNSQFPPSKATLWCGRFERDPSLPFESEMEMDREEEEDVTLRDEAL